MTAAGTAIGDPVSSTPAVSRDKLEEVFEDIRSHVLYDHELHGCLNCGICTATCPSAHYYDYSPREIVQLLWTENLEGIYDAMQEKSGPARSATPAPRVARSRIPLAASS